MKPDDAVVLAVLRDCGGESSTRRLFGRLPKDWRLYSLPGVRSPLSKATEGRRRMHQALRRLKLAGLASNPERGWWTVSGYDPADKKATGV